MKRVGLITLNGNDNYGNRLQNYALQKTIEKMGYKVDTLVPNFPETETVMEKMKRILQLIGNESPASFCGKVCWMLHERSYPQLIEKRKKVFEEFTSKYIHEKRTDKNWDDQNTLNEWNKEYDLFVTGSDQVWRPAYIASNRYRLQFYFLNFADKSKRNSYAASFGGTDFSEDIIQLYNSYVKDMNHISVREQSGQDILKNYFNRDSVVVVDPTMLLSKEEWSDIANKKYETKRKYILVYFLGKMNGRLKREINSYARENQLKIVDLAKKKNNFAYISGPSEFISYIQNAQLVCTDSFHGTVFSILFKTPFLTFERSYSAMMSRIDTLLDTFALQSRKAKSIYEIRDALTCDFTKTDIILEKEREKALEFLRTALSI